MAAGRNAPRGQGGEVFIEFVPVGALVKVNAVDPATGTEVSIMASASVTQDVLARVAGNKLRYVLEKQENPSGA